MLDARANHVVIHQFAVFRTKLGNNKEGDTPGAWWRPFNPSQHHVYNILCEIMLTARDKNLGAGDGVGAIIIQGRLGAQSANIASSLRLSEAHGPTPLTSVQFVHKGALLLLGSVNLEESGSSMGESGIQEKGQICCSEGFYGRQPHDHRESLPSDFQILRHGEPTALSIHLIRSVIGFGHSHLAVLPDTSLFITFTVGRGHLVFRQLPGLLENQVVHFLRIFGIFGGVAELLYVQLLIKDKFDISFIHQ